MLILNNISFSLKANRSRPMILDRISLKVKPGELMAITGPNGSGKSTLAKIIMGITKPSSGRIFWNDVDITKMPADERARLGISYAFQQPVKFKGLNVFDLINIAFGELITPTDAGKYLKDVGLTPDLYLDREIDEKLSGGELKRIEIASVLARKSDLILFDEPEAGIDLWSFNDLVKIFKKLKKQGKTLIIISHQEKILNISDNIVVLNDGKIEAQGKPEKILPLIRGTKR